MMDEHPVFESSVWISTSGPNIEPATRSIDGWLIKLPNPETNEPRWVDGAAVFEFADLAKRAGVEMAFSAFELAARMGKGDDWTWDDARRVRKIFEQMLRAVEQQKFDLRANILGVSYGLLMRRTATRPQVAAWASRMLGRHISTDAWRRAVDKFAKEHDLPPVDLPGGRPRKKNPANDA